MSKLRPIPGGAIETAVELAREHGARVDAPAVLANRANLVVHLQPAPLVARIVAATSGARPGTAWIEREIAVATHLAERGAPVVAPSRNPPAGPHVRAGHVLSFWEWAQPLEAPADPRAAGAALRRCHDALRDYSGALPQMGGLSESFALLEALARQGALAPDVCALARRVASHVESTLVGWEARFQALHGDAHLGNVLSTPDGVAWVDFEDAFRGPPEWDLACLVLASRMGGAGGGAAEEALRAYGGAADDGLLEALVDARAVQAVAWSVYYTHRFEEPPHARDLQIRFLRERARR